MRTSAGDFYSGPDSGKASVRDIYGKKNLGNYTNTFTAAVPPMDALLLRFGFQTEARFSIESYFTFISAPSLQKLKPQML